MGIYLDGDLSNPKFQNCHFTFFFKKKLVEICVYILTYVCIIVSVYCVRAEVTSCLLCDAETGTKDPITPGKLRWSFKQVLINGDEEPFGALCLFCGHTFAKFYEGVPPLEISRNLSIITRKAKKYFSKLRADMVEQMRVIARRASGECASLKRHKSDTSRGA